MPLIPRPYQIDAVNQIQLGISNICVLYPRAGKSFIAKLIIDKYFSNKKVLLICGRRTIILQFEEYFKDSFSWILSGKDYDHNKNIFLASYQTIQRREIDYTEFDCVIFDECHEFAETKTVKKLKETVHTIIGLTATPITAKNKLLKGWDNWIRPITVQSMIENNWLAPTKFFSTNDTIGKFSGDLKKKSTGDYTEESIRRVIAKDGLILRAVDYVISNNITNTYKAALYVNFIDTANEIYKKLKHLDNVYIYHSKRSVKEQKEALEGYNSCTYGVIINVRGLAVGWNSPSTNMIIYSILTPIHALAAQIMLRGSTYLPNKEATVIDLTGQLVGKGALNPYTDFSDYGKVKPTCKEKCLEFPENSMDRYMCLQTCKPNPDSFIVCDGKPSFSLIEDDFKTNFKVEGTPCKVALPFWEYQYKQEILKKDIGKIKKIMICPKCGCKTTYILSTLTEPSTIIELYSEDIYVDQNEIMFIYNKQLKKGLMVISDNKLKNYKYEIATSPEELYTKALKMFKNRKFSISSNVPISVLPNVHRDNSIEKLVNIVDWNTDNPKIMRKVIKSIVEAKVEQEGMKKGYTYFFMKNVKTSNERYIFKQLQMVNDRYDLIKLSKKLEK